MRPPVRWRSLTVAGRMFAAKAPVKLSDGVWPAAAVPSGWGLLCEQSDGPVSTYRVRRYSVTMEPALRYPDAGVPADSVQRPLAVAASHPRHFSASGSGRMMPPRRLGGAYRGRSWLAGCRDLVAPTPTTGVPCG